MSTHSLQPWIIEPGKLKSKILAKEIINLLNTWLQTKITHYNEFYLKTCDITNLFIHSLSIPHHYSHQFRHWPEAYSGPCQIAICENSSRLFSWYQTSMFFPADAFLHQWPNEARGHLNMTSPGQGRGDRGSLKKVTSLTQSGFYTGHLFHFCLCRCFF